MPSVETTSGPLGEGLAQGVGMALGAKMDGKDFHVWVVTSDAEHQCGLHWEAVMTGAKFKLDNSPRSSIATSFKSTAAPKTSCRSSRLREKYRSFNWEVFECDGNDMAAFIETAERARAVQGKPQVIIANTFPARASRIWRATITWHGKPPNAAQADEALRELAAERERILADG